jgi:hypothetical protein
MLRRVFEAEVPAQWVADMVYGTARGLRLSSKNWDAPTCRGDRDARRLPRGHQRRARTLAKHLPEEAGVRASAGKVSKGERLYEWACVALPDPDGAETGCWLADRGLFRCSQGGGRPGRVRGQKVGRLVPPRQPLHIRPRYLAVVRSVTEHEERATKGGISSQKISTLS